MRITTCLGDRTRSRGEEAGLCFCTNNASGLTLYHGLKRQVSGIKIVTVYRRSIFQVECVRTDFD